MTFWRAKYAILAGKNRGSRVCTNYTCDRDDVLAGKTLVAACVRTTLILARNKEAVVLIKILLPKVFQSPLIFGLHSPPSLTDPIMR